MKKRILGAVLAATLVMASLAGCSSDKTADSSNVTNAATTAAEKKLSGSITLSGSTSMEKLANALAESFMAKYPDVTVSPEFTGSGAGIEAVTNGKVDIGNSSRNLKDAEKQAGAVENIVAIDGIAVIVDKSNTVTNLTKDQLISIYKGEIKVSFPSVK